MNEFDEKMKTTKKVIEIEPKIQELFSEVNQYTKSHQTLEKENQSMQREIKSLKTRNHNLAKEKTEGAKLLWVDDSQVLKLITECYDNLKESKYENLYHSKFIVLRDRYILEYYLKNK